MIEHLSLRAAAQPNFPRHAFDLPLRRRIRWPRFAPSVSRDDAAAELRYGEATAERRFGEAETSIGSSPATTSSGSSTATTRRRCRVAA